MTNDKFRDAIELHFGDRTDIETKEFLGQLMRKRHFHDVSGKAKYPTQKQLDGAWDHLKSRETYVISEETQIQRERYTIIPRGFKKQQYRDKKTGRIIGWSK